MGVARLRRLLPSDRRLALALVLVVCLTVGLRLPGALDSALWQDEVASARVIVRPSFGEMLDQVRATESAPPAWYALAWAGHRAGLTLTGLRLLSVVFSAALAALVVVAARRLLPLWAATLAGALVALGWQFLFHGSELRAYALLALLALAFAFLLERAAAIPSLPRLGALAVVAAAGALTHYFFLLTVLAGLAWLWSERGARPARLRVSAATCIGLAAFLPWLPDFLEQYRQGRFDWIAAFDPLRAAYLYSGLFSDVGPLYATAGGRVNPGEAIVRLAIVAAVLAGFVLLWRRSPRGRLIALLGLLPVLAAAVVWLAGPRIFDVRNLIVVGPFAAIALAAACSALPRPAATAAAAGAIAFAAFGIAQHGLVTRPAYDQVAEALVDQGWHPGDPVVLLGTAHALRSPLRWYLGEDDAARRAGAPGGSQVYLVTQRWRRIWWRGFRKVSAGEQYVQPFVVSRIPHGEPARQLLAIDDGRLLGPVYSRPS